MNQKIAIIPARGGSQRIPGKNIKNFLGKPLIAYSIKAALKSKLFDKIIVSTDDKKIAKIAKKYDAEIPFLRPKNLADNFTGTKAVMDHTLKYFQAQGKEYNYACLIYATAPFLQTQYLLQGFKKLSNSDASSSFSCTSMPFPIQRTFKINKNERCQMFYPQHYFTRSQDLEKAYQDAGQFYWYKINKTTNDILFGNDSIPIILPRYLVQDIDTLEDWVNAELMYETLNKK